MKKVLIISYYWPPNGGTGVQRWMHFAKYLKQLGWDVAVFTPENAEAAVIDPQLLEYVKEIPVFHSKLWEPLGFYRKLTGKKKKEPLQSGFLNSTKKPSIFEKTALWIRANFFIPDAKKFWIKPAIQEIIKLQKEQSFTHMVSTGPPHSVHLIALGVKEKLQINWLADFRDPWTNIDWFPKLPLTKKSLNSHKKLEFNVLKKADIVVTVTPTLSKEYSEMSKRKVHTLTNGFEPSDFQNLDLASEKRLVFFHHGSMNADRNPNKLWEFLGKQVVHSKEWRERLLIQCVGAVDQSILSEIEKNGLNNHFELIPFVPHHQVLESLSKSSLCFLPVNNTQNANGIMPNKLFEYIAAEKPILLIGPTEGDAATALSNSENVYMVDFDEEIQLENINSILNAKFNSQLKDTFNRAKIAESMSKLLSSLK